MKPRDVALAVKGTLEANASPTPVHEYVKPSLPLPYVWFPLNVTIIPGRTRDGLEATFTVSYRARGKGDVEQLAQAANFVDGLTIPKYGDMVWGRYTLGSRIGPMDDPDVPNAQQIVDTFRVKFWSEIYLAG